ELRTTLERCLWMRQKVFVPNHEMPAASTSDNGCGRIGQPQCRPLCQAEPVGSLKRGRGVERIANPNQEGYLRQERLPEWERERQARVVQTPRPCMISLTTDQR